MGSGGSHGYRHLFRCVQCLSDVFDDVFYIFYTD